MRHKSFGNMHFAPGRVVVIDYETGGFADPVFCAPPGLIAGKTILPHQPRHRRSPR